MSQIISMFVFGLLMLSFSFAADCARESYVKSCSHCTFEESGKMEQSCYKSQESAGQSCFAASYPITSMKYANGECPQIDECSAQLQQCKAMLTSGNDKTDCEQAYLADCFYQADACMADAAKECETEFKPCPLSLIMMALLGFGFMKYSRKA